MISKNNIPLMYIIGFCRNLMFSLAITYLFYNHYNLGTTELFIIQSVFSIGMVFLEIPTGFISDKFSRKSSLVIGLLFSALGFIVYSQGTIMLHFILSELILVIGYTCISGTDTAILYDSIAHDGEIKKYKEYSGRYNSIGLLAQAIGGIGGAYIGLYGLSIPFLLDGIFIFFAFILSLFIIEPPRKKQESQEGSWTQIKNILLWTYQHPKIFWIIIFSAVVSSITQSMVWFSQPYMKLVGVPIIYFGWFWFAMNILDSLISLFIHRVEKYLTQKIFMITIVVLSILCMLILAVFPYIRIVPVFVLFKITRQGNRIVSNDNLHLLSHSSIRATVQSINSIAFRLTFGIRGPIFGWLYSNYGLIIALGSASIVLGGIAIVALQNYEKSSNINL